LTDNSLDDTLKWIRGAEVQTMSKAERASYLHSRGWRKLNGGTTPKWRSPDGIVATTAAACRLQAIADMEGCQLSELLGSYRCRTRQPAAPADD
jgi:hypothetical protein